jgi:RimJ/RimL family protein N-acetyltransferase
MKVIIRNLRPTDADISWHWRNDADVWSSTGRKWNHFVSRDTEKEWIEKVIQNEHEKRFAICVGDEEKYVGNVYLTDITNKTAVFSIFIGDKSYWGKGIATDATKLILSFAKELELTEIYLKVKQTHTPALRAYVKNGFEILETVGDDYLMVFYVNEN